MMTGTPMRTTLGVPPAGTGLPQRSPVPLCFWVAAGGALIARLAGIPIDQNLFLWAAAGLMLLGGLPHGAFDIALAMRAFRLDRRTTVLVVGAYVMVALMMFGLWQVAPVAALALFLMFSAVHFGEDWTMLEPGLLRVMAGASIITAPAIGQPGAVVELFDALAGAGQGALLARIAVAAAPVTLLVTLVGLQQACKTGNYGWAAAQATALACLLATPPQIGFLIYFVLLHSPRHLTGIGAGLSGWSRQQVWLYGSGITLLCIVVGLLASRGFWSPSAAIFSAEGFRLLSIVAAPHLLLSIMVARHLDRHQQATGQSQLSSPQLGTSSHATSMTAD